jgi:hypothetical protein
MAIQLRANPGPTGRMLRTMLQEKGLLNGEVRGVVNYGYGGQSTLPTLNRRAGTFNKLKELEMLHAKGVATVPFSRSPRDLVAPLMGRSLHHTRGNDILLYRTTALLGNRNLPHHDFYTQLVPKQREFRIWSYRRKVIGCYEKILAYPNKLGRRGRLRDVWNYKNGYAFEFRRPEDIVPELKTLASQAVEACGLDFGAVDAICGVDGAYRVLEVNSAPGVEGPRQCITSLVNHIERWAQGGFKRRNGEDAQ